MALVAAHAWDCHGARRAGVLGESLVEVVEGLLQLPG